MSSIRFASTIIAAGLFVGCTPAPKQSAPPVAPAAATISLDEAQARFKTVNPYSSVGAVKAVRADQSMLAVSDVSNGGLNVDDVVSIVEPRESFPLVANGTVDRITGGFAIVKYTFAGHTPKAGDFVVRLPDVPHVSGASGAPASPAAPMSPAPQSTTPPPGGPATPSPESSTPAPAAAPATPTAPETPPPPAAPATPPAPQAQAPATPEPTPAPAPTPTPAPAPGDVPAPTPPAAPAPSATETPTPAPPPAPDAPKPDINK